MEKATGLNTYFKVPRFNNKIIYFYVHGKNMFKTKIHNLTALNEMERTDTLIKLNACTFI